MQNDDNKKDIFGKLLQRFQLLLINGTISSSL